MKEKGFTIIELLVVISIVSVFPAIIISNFPQARLQFTLSRTVHAFAQNMRKVQDMALSATPYINSSGLPQPISGYGVYIDPVGVLGNKKYVLYADAEPANQQYDSLDYIVATTDFSVSEPGIMIKEIKNISGSSVSVNFNPPKPDTVITPLTPGFDKIVIVFGLESNPLKTREVSVSNNGLIEVK